MSGQAAMDRDASDYQSLSPLAAIALLLGLLSPAALATPLLLIVPAAAVGVALLGLAKIRSSDGALTGAGMARWGLAIALACGVATFVRDPVRDALMRRQTDAVAEQWLTLLAAGQIDGSLKLLGSQALQSLGPKSEAGPDQPAAEQPKPAELHVIVVEKLRSDKLTTQLARLKQPVRVAPQRLAGSAPVLDGGRTMLIENYLAKGADGGPSCRVQLRFGRSAYYESAGQAWRIESWQLLDESLSGGSLSGGSLSGGP